MAKTVVSTFIRWRTLSPARRLVLSNVSQNMMVVVTRMSRLKDSSSLMRRPRDRNCL